MRGTGCQCWWGGTGAGCLVCHTVGTSPLITSADITVEFYPSPPQQYKEYCDKKWDWSWNRIISRITMKSYHLKWSSHLPNMGLVFSTLYQSEGLSDVSLCCDDGSVRAHKLLLSTCSDYFLVSCDSCWKCLFSIVQTNIVSKTDNYSVNKTTNYFLSK